MADDKYTFEQARIRLEEIAVEVRKKDTSLEKSLDLLEEGVRLANICTELVDHTDTGASVEMPRAEDSGDAGETSDATLPEGEAGESDPDGDEADEVAEGPVDEQTGADTAE